MSDSARRGSIGIIRKSLADIERAFLERAARHHREDGRADIRQFALEAHGGSATRAEFAARVLAGRPPANAPPARACAVRARPPGFAFPRHTSAGTATPGASNSGWASSVGIGMWRAGVGVAANSSAVRTSINSKRRSAAAASEGSRISRSASSRGRSRMSAQPGAAHSQRRGALSFTLEKFMKSISSSSPSS